MSYLYLTLPLFFYWQYPHYDSATGKFPVVIPGSVTTYDKIGKMYKLDEKDHRLILALKKNSRASLVALGRDIGLSRSATHDRITRLEELDVIRAYTVIVNEKTMPVTRAFFTIKLKIGHENSLIANTIAGKPGIKSTYCLSGDIDMIVYCECNNVAQLCMLRDEISLIKGVAEINTRNILSSNNH